VRYEVLITLTEDCCVLGCDAVSKVLVYQTALLHFRLQQSSWVLLTDIIVLPLYNLPLDTEDKLSFLMLGLSVCMTACS